MDFKAGAVLLSIKKEHCRLLY